VPNWEGSDRRDRLPDNWRELRVIVAQRAAWRCQNYIDGNRCQREGRHCDHIRRGDDHCLANLQWLCPPCHNSKSGREGALAQSVTREREPHPGLRPAFRAPPGGRRPKASPA
jgi:5-methylcytosine-specific restriction enzyme A